jgi:hypothetical protein
MLTTAHIARMLNILRFLQVDQKLSRSMRFDVYDTNMAAAVWPPQDPAALFSMMQNASMNGLPPPLPGFAFPPQPFHPPTSQYPPPPMSFPPQPPHSIMAASERIHEIVDSDREDGEVSDAEAGSKLSAGKANGRTFAEAPRSVPQAKPASPQVEEGYNPNRPAAGQKSVKESAPKKTPPLAVQSPADALQQSREQAKQFIKLLHCNNIGYRALAKEDLDHDQLRGLYQSLNLPSEPAPILPLKETSSMHKPSPQASASPAVQPVPGGPVQEQKPGPTVKTNIHAASASNSAPSPVDRKDYIARLQAAKLAKASAAKASPPQQTPPVVAAPPAPTVKTPHATAPSTAKPPITDEQRARNTELIKQRLEAMKAKKQSAPATNVSTPAPTRMQTSESTRPAPLDAAQQAPSVTTTPSHQPYTSPFPGIPGLFMNPPPSFDSTNSRATSSVQQKRPIPSDSNELSTPRGSATPYTRPLGDSPHVYQEEPMIIEVSDDESNASEMDIDEDHVPSKVAVTSSLASSQHRVPGAIPDFPSRQTSVLPGSSAVSTPGPQTPATQAREQELKKKEDQLAAMRLTLKRKLAEKREKDRAAAAAATLSPTAQTATTKSTSLLNGVTADLQPTASGPPPSMSVESISASADSMNDASELIRDVKRRRREEIQSKLPSFDAELAMNTDRMAHLMKEMEQLKAQSERITKDKEQLTRELEGLGVDTEGMSHAEMRAKKDEIEHDMSSEAAPVTQGTINDSVPSMDATVDAPSVPAVDTQQKPVEAAATSNMVPLLSSEPAAKQSFLPGLGHGFQPPSQTSVADKVSTVDATRVVTAGTQLHNLPAPTKDFVAPANTAAPSQAQEFNTPPDEDDDFYSPAPARESISDKSLNMKGTTQAPSEAQIVDAPSPSEEGEVEMSLSSSDEEEEEEYEPEEPAMVTDMPNPDAQIPEAETSKPVASEDVSTEDEEAYEPPDVDEDMPDSQVESLVEQNTDVVNSEVEADEGAMDIASSSSDESSSDSDSDSDGEIDSQSGNDETISANHALQQPTNVADDLAPELQPESTLEPVRDSPTSLANQEKVSAADCEAGPVEFTPYQSPLRMFKSYRYHPQFAQDVSGGFLSTTYSHQIDPEKPLCQYETAGGSCNDAECTNQHFRDLGISGVY